MSRTHFAPQNGAGKGDFAVERNGAGGIGAMVGDLVHGASGRLGARWAGAVRGGLVFGAPGAWGRAVFGGPARLGQGGLST